MEIEEWRPPPRSEPPPQPPRKSRQGLILTLIGVGTFLITLAVLNWHNLTARTPQVAAAVDTPKSAQLPTSTTMANTPHVREVSAMAAQNITSIAACISGNAVASGDREQLIKMILAQAGNEQPAVLSAFESGTVDPQGVTTLQASGFMGLLDRVQGPLASKAQQGFQQGIQEGTCKIAPPPVFTQGVPPPPAS